MMKALAAASTTPRKGDVTMIHTAMNTSKLFTGLSVALGLLGEGIR